MQTDKNRLSISAERCC